MFKRKEALFMTTPASRHVQLAAIIPALRIPVDVQLRCWRDSDMPDIQRLVDQHGWPTHHEPEEVLAAWRNAWPALVATQDEHVIGYVQALTDENVLMHITDLLVDPNRRKQGIGRLLLQACHLLYPRVLINLVAEKEAIPFYEAVGYRHVGESYGFHKRFW
jgi:ribosomal protein S18 acetylase RimI-like enzyme